MKIAIDAVLLPDDPVRDLALQLNQKLIYNFNSEIQLHQDHCQPHISLAMGVIEDNQIEAIKSELKSTQPLIPEKLAVSGIKVNINAKNEPVSSLEIEKTPSLESLHRRIMKKIKPFLCGPARPQMFFGHEPIAETSLDWVTSYSKKSAYDNFWPHITLGYGRLDECDINFPLEFTPKTLALCQLGNHCTCRKILLQFE